MRPRATRCDLRRRLWRWRRNPLRRRADVIEAWTLLLTVVVMAVGGAALGVTTALLVEQPLMAQHENRHQTRAELVEDVPKRPKELGEPGIDRVRAAVRWTDPSGTARTGQTRVDEGRKAGDEVTIWTDGRGELTTAPLSPEQAATRAAVLGAMTATGFCCLSLVGYRQVQRRLDRDRVAQWERAWAEVGPRWSGRV